MIKFLTLIFTFLYANKKYTLIEESGWAGHRFIQNIGNQVIGIHGTTHTGCDIDVETALKELQSLP